MRTKKPKPATTARPLNHGLRPSSTPVSSRRLAKTTHQPPTGHASSLASSTSSPLAPLDRVAESLRFPLPADAPATLTLLPARRARPGDISRGKITGAAGGPAQRDPPRYKESPPHLQIPGGKTNPMARAEDTRRETQAQNGAAGAEQRHTQPAPEQDSLFPPPDRPRAGAAHSEAVAPGSAGPGRGVPRGTAASHRGLSPSRWKERCPGRAHGHRRTVPATAAQGARSASRPALPRCHAQGYAGRIERPCAWAPMRETAAAPASAPASRTL